jgi:hypothetical protein
MSEEKYVRMVVIEQSDKQSQNCLNKKHLLSPLYYLCHPSRFITEFARLNNHLYCEKCNIIMKGKIIKKPIEKEK